MSREPKTRESPPIYQEQHQAYTSSAQYRTLQGDGEASDGPVWWDGWHLEDGGGGVGGGVPHGTVTTVHQYSRD